LWLGALLLKPALLGHDDSAPFHSAFNFGPHPEANRTVQELVEEILKHWPGSWHSAMQSNAPHEAGLLSLAIDKAIHTLGWWPVWDFSHAVQETTSWYRRFLEEDCDGSLLVNEQIGRYVGDARSKGVKWSLAT
jgi:CDP-glucose 4,6-dehydratase